MAESKLIKKYPWLTKVNTVEDYLPPEYYAYLLKPYTFGGVSDLNILKSFIKDKYPTKILELGCGSGRASSVVVERWPSAKYMFSDLSEQMLNSAKKHLQSDASFVVSDAINYMEDTTDTFDFVYTLWSFSHSTHQHCHYLGNKEAESYISKTLKKFIRENISSGGSFFLIHFDSLSQEQRTLMRQWQRVFKTFTNIDEQSPSKQIIEKTLTDLDTQGEIQLSIQHLKGDSIHYASKDEVLEIYMNFHLETYFNELPLASEVLDDIREQIEQYRNVDGSYDITPGCYVYSFVKN